MYKYIIHFIDGGKLSGHGYVALEDGVFHCFNDKNDVVYMIPVQHVKYIHHLEQFDEDLFKSSDTEK